MSGETMPCQAPGTYGRDCSPGGNDILGERQDILPVQSYLAGLIERVTELSRQKGFHEDEMVAQFRRCFVVGRDLLKSERAVEA